MLRSFKLPVFVVISAFILTGCAKTASTTKSSGIQVVLRVKSAANDPVKVVPNEAKLVSVISSKADSLLKPGQKSSVVIDKDRITIKLPGLSSLDKVTANKVFTENAELGFYWLRDVKSEKNLMAKWELLYDVGAENGTTHSFKNTKTKETLSGNTTAGMAKIMTRVVNAYDPVNNPKGMKPILTQNHLKPKSKAALNQDAPVLLIEFNPEGTKIFRDFTRNHVGDILAIIANGKILSAPVINEPIPRGKAEISGFRSLKEAEQFANLLNAGTLPVPLAVESIDSY